MKIGLLVLALSLSGCVGIRQHDEEMEYLRHNQAANATFVKEFAKGFEIQAKSISILSELTQILSDNIGTLEKRVGDLESKKVKK